MGPQKCHIIKATIKWLLSIIEYNLATGVVEITRITKAQDQINPPPPIDLI